MYSRAVNSTQKSGILLSAMLIPPPVSFVTSYSNRHITHGIESQAGEKDNIFEYQHHPYISDLPDVFFRSRNLLVEALHRCGKSSHSLELAVEAHHGHVRVERLFRLLLERDHPRAVVDCGQNLAALDLRTSKSNENIYKLKI